jgi:hypothetical protein
VARLAARPDRPLLKLLFFWYATHAFRRVFFAHFFSPVVNLFYLVLLSPRVRAWAIRPHVLVLVLLSPYAGASVPLALVLVSP